MGGTSLKTTIADYWSIDPGSLLDFLQSAPNGLKEEEAQHRFQALSSKPTFSLPRDFSLMLSQFKSPIVILLIVSSLLSATVRDFTDAAIILSIIFFSGFLGYWQERGAQNAQGWKDP